MRRGVAITSREVHMNSISVRAKLVLFIAVCLLGTGALLGAAGVVGADAAYAARADITSSAQKIGVFEDVVINAGETWENVVVVGGDVTVFGTVENVVVVVGGDAYIRSGARVGVGHSRDQQAIVVVFGDVTVDGGAAVNGDIFQGVNSPGWLGVAAIAPDYESWSWGSLAGWVWLAVFLALVAVVAVAIAPRQVAFVRERIRRHFFSSLGWGVLLAIIVVPLVTILLIITLVGILLLVPWLGVVVPVIWLFGFVSLGALLGGFILRRRPEERGPLMLAAVLGVLILSVLWWIPVAGGIVLFVLGLVGFGATCVSVWEARRSKRRRPKMPQGGFPAGTLSPGAVPPGTPPGGQAVVPPAPAPGYPPTYSPTTEVSVGEGGETPESRG